MVTLQIAVVANVINQNRIVLLKNFIVLED